MAAKKEIRVSRTKLTDVLALVSTTSPEQEPVVSYSISRDILAAASANFIYCLLPFQAFYEKKLLPRRNELIGTVLKSKYPNVIPLVRTEFRESLEKFLCFYGILLSDNKADQLLIMRQVDKAFHLNCASQLQDQSSSFPIPDLKVIDYVPCVLNALSHVMAGCYLENGDNFEQKLYVLISLQFCLSSLFGIDLNEIQIDEKPVDIFIKRSIRKCGKEFDLSLEDVCAMFCSVNGITSAGDFLPEAGTVFSYGFHKAAKEFFELLSGEDSSKENVFRDVLTDACLSYCCNTIPSLLEERDAFIKELFKEEDEPVEEPEDDSLPDPLAEAIAERNALAQKLSSLQKERDTLSQRVNDLRKDLSALTADNDSYRDQLNKIQAAEKDDVDDEDEEIGVEPLSEEDMNLLRDMRVVIFGGHDRMHKHMIQDNMGWTYIGPKESVPKNMLDCADLIVIISRYVAHSSYAIVRNYAENNPAIKKKIIHTSYKNKDRIYRQIFDWIAA